MKSLRLTLVLLAAIGVAIAQRAPTAGDSRPSPAPSSSAGPSSSANSGGGGLQSHSSAPSSGGGGSQSHAAPASSGAGAGAARSSGGNTNGGGRPDMGGGRSDRSNAGGASRSNASGATRSDHNFNGTRSNTPSNDRHGQPASTGTKGEAFHGRDGEVPRSGKQPAGNNVAPDVRRDRKGDLGGTGKPVDHNAVTPETKTPKHFHWFWQKRKVDGANELAKTGHPELKPTPCKGINCKPVCPSGQTAGERGGCVPVTPIHATCDGTIDAHGNCIASDPCTNNGVYNPSCPQYANRMSHRNDCSSEASQIALLRHEIEVLKERAQLVCAQDPNGPICKDATEQLRRAEEQLMQLERQYQYCQSTRSQYP